MSKFKVGDRIYQDYSNRVWEITNINEFNLFIHQIQECDNMRALKQWVHLDEKWKLYVNVEDVWQKVLNEQI